MHGFSRYGDTTVEQPDGHVSRCSRGQARRTARRDIDRARAPVRPKVAFEGSVHVEPMAEKCEQRSAGRGDNRRKCIEYDASPNVGEESNSLHGQSVCTNMQGVLSWFGSRRQPACNRCIIYPEPGNRLMKIKNTCIGNGGVRKAAACHSHHRAAEDASSTGLNPVHARGGDALERPRQNEELEATSHRFDPLRVA